MTSTLENIKSQKEKDKSKKNKANKNAVAGERKGSSSNVITLDVQRKRILANQKKEGFIKSSDKNNNSSSEDQQSDDSVSVTNNSSIKI